MAVDREYVLQFLNQVDAEIVSFLNGEAQRFHRREALLARYKSEYETWKSGAVEHVRGITEVVNEMCVARVFLEDRENCEQLYYEPPTDQRTPGYRSRGVCRSSDVRFNAHLCEVRRHNSRNVCDVTFHFS